MIFNNDKWLESYKKAAQDCKGSGPSDGIVCILATLRYICAGMCDDVGNKTDDDKAVCETISESIKELYDSLNTAKTTSGFASNASAGAKAAKLMTTREKALVPFS